jgi:O-antigen/teichoic acid export membrane protein
VLSFLRKKSEFLWSAFSQVIQFLSGILLLKMLSTYFTIEDYGQYSLIIAITAFVLTVPFTAFEQGFFRYRNAYLIKGLSGEFYSSMIYFVLFVSFIYISLGTVSYLYFHDNESFWSVLYIPFVFMVFGDVLKVYTRCIANADRKRKLFSISIIIEFFVKLFGIVLLKYLDCLSVVNVIYVFTIATFSCSIVLLFSYQREFVKLNLPVFIDINKKVFLFALPLLLWSGFGWTRDMSMRWFLEYNATLIDVAIFTILSSIATVLPKMIQSVVSVYIMPIMYESNKGKQSEINGQGLLKLVKLLVLLGFIFFSFIYFFSGFVVSTLTDSKYAEHSQYLPYMFICYYLFCCSQIYSSLLLVNFKPYKLFFPNLISGLVVLVSGIVFVPQYGFVSAIYSYCLSYLLFAIISVFITYKTCGVKA